MHGRSTKQRRSAMRRKALLAWRGYLRRQERRREFLSWLDAGPDVDGPAMASIHIVGEWVRIPNDSVWVETPDRARQWLLHADGTTTPIPETP